MVFHDSLLPRYRGFAPLVNALIQGEKEIGVTALWGADDYDRGSIIEQAAVAASYPVTIQTAINAVIPLYERLAIDVVRRLVAGEDVRGHAQDEQAATYSMWRDEEDYRIDWTQSATRISRFIDAVGAPYRGALSHIGDQKVRILRSQVEPAQFVLELRHPGKVFSITDGFPTVVCGEGLLRLLEVSDAATGESLLPWKRLRTRFRNS